MSKEILRITYSKTSKGESVKYNAVADAALLKRCMIFTIIQSSYFHSIFCDLARDLNVVSEKSIINAVEFEDSLRTLLSKDFDIDFEDVSNT